MSLVSKYRKAPLAVRAAAWFSVCNALQSGARFLMMPFLTRMMSAEEYGLLAVYNSWLAIVAIFVTLNLAAGVFNKAMSLYPDERDEYTSSMMGLLFVLSSAFGVFVVLFHETFQRLLGLTTPYIVFMFVNVVSDAVFSLWASRKRYEYDYRPLIVGTVCYVLLAMILSLLAVYTTSAEVVPKSLAHVSSWALVRAAVALVLLGTTLRKSAKLVRVEYWKFALLFNIPLIPHYLAQVVLGQVDRIMIAGISGDEFAAIYTVAYQVSITLMILVNAINATVTPWLYERLSRGEHHGIGGKFDSILALFAILSVLATLVAPEIIFAFAPEEYSEAIYVIPPVCSSMVFLMLYGLYASVEFYYLSNKFVSFATCCGAVLNVLLNFFLIPEFGYLAAGYTTLLSYSAMAAMHAIFANHLIKRNLGVSIYSNVRLWLIALGAAGLSVALCVLYPYFALRWMLLAAVVLVFFIQRKRVASCLRGVVGKSGDGSARK